MTQSSMLVSSVYNDNESDMIRTMPPSSDDTFNGNQGILDELSGKKAVLYIPILLFLLILMVVGTIGNIFVIYVYIKKFKRVTARYFILSLAIFDLLTCVIALPTEMYDLLHSYNFQSYVACKILRYIVSVATYGSVFILIGIGLDRYLKVCKPLMMLEVYKLKGICAVSGIISILFGIPSAILFGISRAETSKKGVNGYDCSIEEKYRKSSFAIVYYAMLGIVFVFMLLLLSGIYLRIWLEVKRRQTIVTGQFASALHESGVEVNFQQSRLFRSSRSKNENSNDHETGESEDRPVHRPRMNSIAEVIRRVKISRITVVLFVVTIAFMITFLPAIVIMICRSVIKDLEDNQSDAVDVVSKFFSKFYLLNCAINPVIYSFLNKNFRRQFADLLKHLFSCHEVGRLYARKRSLSGSKKTDRSTRVVNVS
ncbi:hypothetical protein CHS0354_009047 [Potamilus streckersoni]|uniref:G-protein coupled receptors family 1 profile domain-containing protein n=1 Tax=Potamilus streckersoni TaxID=2493646 RepID=A0AAE0THP5_9BIVA|nr:hypothetical protein CHS0354_009047 [Potamilus streckersoni]